MRIRLPWLVVVALFFPATAHAHGHTWDLSGGPGFGEGSVLSGVRVTLGITTKRPVNEDLSFIADLTNLKGTHADEDVTQLMYLGGGRYTLTGAAKKHLIMVHALAGVMHRQQGAGDSTNFAVTAGVAYEFVPRGTPAGWAARVQVERAAVKNVKDFYQYSLAVVRRFD